MASRMADAAFDWMKKHGQKDGISTDDLWKGMQKAYPELTAVSEHRKTPRTTLMRDLRKDRNQRFIVQNRRVRLA
jgi:hypothetical protein